MVEGTGLENRRAVKRTEVRIPPLPFYGHSLKVELRSPKPSVWVQFLLPVLIIMAGVVKWLTHQIVALACVGSIPITRLFYIIGV